MVEKYLRVRSFLLIFVALWALSACASRGISTTQNTSKQKRPLANIHIIDRNGMTETISSKDRLKIFDKMDFLSSQSYQKVIRVFAPDPTGLKCSIVTTYYANGQLKQYLEASNGRAMGRYAEWHANGKKKLECTLMGGVADVDEKAQDTWIFDGLNKAWDENGCLIAEIPYSKGFLQGKALYYYPDGRLSRTIPYEKSQIQGKLEAFYPDGSLKEETQFLHGVKAGESIGYWANKQLAWQEAFQNGNLMQGVYFDKWGNQVCLVENGCGKRGVFEEGRICALVEIKDGVSEGEVAIIDKTEVVSSIYHVRDDKKHGEEIFYYPSKNKEIGFDTQKLNPKLSIHWIDGKIQGVVKTWYENGRLESQREMSNNQKHGIFAAWYRDGSLMFIEEYDQDRLIKGEYLKRGEATPVSKISGGAGLAVLFDADGNILKKVNYLDGKPVE